MNTNNIKKYAPQARNDFRDAVIQKLTTLGIAADLITRYRPFPAANGW